MVHQLKIFNSISGKKEIFIPIHKKNVGMYVCGPTVYSNVHLGNLRTFISFDFIYRSLQHLGYKVRYVRNITDAGHLTDDGNIDNDRFVKQSRLEKLEPMEIVQKYTINFHKVLEIFNLLPPNIEPTATGHIIEQIELTQKLINEGLAYENNGSVYFDVAEYNTRGLNYGMLSNKNVEELFTNTRNLDGQGEKKNPHDFALWKKAAPAHIMRWKSPWGEGFPGWHIECTAMSTKYLGEKFDIHGGGMDLKFPHHECEIAQAKGYLGESPVNYWMHTNMLTMNGQRMSKSSGNYILPMELINGNNSFFEKDFPAEVVRFCFLQAHYRSVLDISNDAMIASEKGFNRLMKAMKQLFKIETNSSVSSINIKTWKEQCYTALTDDFNSPILIAHIFEAVKWISSIESAKESISKEDLDILRSTMNSLVFDVLGLKVIPKNGNNKQLNQVLNILVSLRNQAREAKDFQLSDQIRNELLEQGIELKDGKDGTTYIIH